MPTESPASPLVPPAIADYEMLRPIGRGSYGDVWLARGVTGVFRAVKIVWRDRFPDIRPYEREFEGITRFAAISVREPSQLALLHAGRQDAAGFFYYVMELADDVTHGREIDPATYVPYTLKDYAARHGPQQDTAEVVALGVALARALASLHAAGMVHRDIKPSNVILVGGVPKLADVGLVAMASAALTFVGTEGFVPPEGPGAPSADVYSLGKLLYELATGLDRHDWPRLPADFDRRPDQRAFLELNEVLVRACEPDPSRRFVDASALLDELLLLQAGKSVRRLRRAERRTARALRIAAVLALVAGLAGVGAYVERQRANAADGLRRAAEAELAKLAQREIYSASLVQSERALEQNDYGRARQFLGPNLPKQGPDDLRGFEWHALWNDAQGDPATILRASGSAGQKVRYSAAANVIAVSTADNEAILWDATSHQELRRIKGIGQMVGFSRDGKWLAGVAAGGYLRRWRTDDGTPDLGLDMRATWAFGPTEDNQWVAIGFRGPGETHYLRGFDLETGQEIWQRPLPFTGGEDHGNYYSGALTPDGRMIAIALAQTHGPETNWRVLVLSLPDLKIIWSEETAHRPSVMAFGSDKETLLVASDDIGEVNLFDFIANKLRWHAAVPMSRLTTLVHDGSRVLAVGGRSGSVTLLDLITGAVVGAKQGHEADVQDAVFLSDGQFLSTGAGGDLRLWPARGDHSPREIAGFWSPPGGGRALCVSPNGRWVAATCSPTQVRVISTESGKTVAEIAATCPVAFTADGKNLWTVTGDGVIERDVSDVTMRTLQKIPLPFNATMAAASANGYFFLCADYARGTLAFCDVRRAVVSPAIVSGHDYIYWLALSGDGSRAATSGRDLVVRIWDVATGKVTATWKMAGQMINGAFSNDGTRLAVIQNLGVLEVRDIAGRISPVKLATTSGILQAIAFHPTEPRLLLGGRDGIMHVVDTVNWKEVAQLPSGLTTARPGTMSRAMFAADGRLLAGYTESGVIRLWRKEPSRP